MRACCRPCIWWGSRESYLKGMNESGVVSAGNSRGCLRAVETADMLLVLGEWPIGNRIAAALADNLAAGV